MVKPARIVRGINSGAHAKGKGAQLLGVLHVPFIAALTPCSGNGSPHSPEDRALPCERSSYKTLLHHDSIFIFKKNI